MEETQDHEQPVQQLQLQLQQLHQQLQQREQDFEDELQSVHSQLKQAKQEQQHWRAVANQWKQELHFLTLNSEQESAARAKSSSCQDSATQTLSSSFIAVWTQTDLPLTLTQSTMTTTSSSAESESEPNLKIHHESTASMTSLHEEVLESEKVQQLEQLVQQLQLKLQAQSAKTLMTPAPSAGSLPSLLDSGNVKNNTQTTLLNMTGDATLSGINVETAHPHLWYQFSRLQAHLARPWPLSAPRTDDENNKEGEMKDGNADNADLPTVSTMSFVYDPTSLSSQEDVHRYAQQLSTWLTLLKEDVTRLLMGLYAEVQVLKRRARKRERKEERLLVEGKAEKGRAGEEVDRTGNTTVWLGCGDTTTNTVLEPTTSTRWLASTPVVPSSSQRSQIQASPPPASNPTLLAPSTLMSASSSSSSAVVKATQLLHERTVQLRETQVQVQRLERRLAAIQETKNDVWLEEEAVVGVDGKSGGTEHSSADAETPSAHQHKSPSSVVRLRRRGTINSPSTPKHLRSMHSMSISPTKHQKMHSPRLRRGTWKRFWTWMGFLLLGSIWGIMLAGWLVRSGMVSPLGAGRNERLDMDLDMTMDRNWYGRDEATVGMDEWIQERSSSASSFPTAPSSSDVSDVYSMKDTLVSVLQDGWKYVKAASSRYPSDLVSWTDAEHWWTIIKDRMDWVLESYGRGVIYPQPPGEDEDDSVNHDVSGSFKAAFRIASDVLVTGDSASHRNEIKQQATDGKERAHLDSSAEQRAPELPPTVPPETGGRLFV